MSSQSGIVCNDHLEAFLAKCRDGDVRLVKVSISMGEGGSMPELVLDKSLETVGGWEEDWDPMVPGLVEADTPCFILYRLDEKDSGGCFLWVLLSWSPDTSHTRSFSVTKATLQSPITNAL